jgi:hypothetical protein
MNIFAISAAEWRISPKREDVLYSAWNEKKEMAIVDDNM